MLDTVKATVNPHTYSPISELYNIRYQFSAKPLNHSLLSSASKHIILMFPYSMSS